MTRRTAARSIVALVLAVASGWTAAPALAGWQLSGTTFTSILYNQGIAYDRARGNVFFDGVTSTTNSGLYRTNAQLSLTGANFGVLPATTEGFNHTGDLTFDPLRRRILLPLECYYPARGGNTCGVGAIGVADPVTLRFLYYVDLAPSQIAKAMWAEIDPSGRWIWTSSGTHLLVYRVADVNPSVAARQRAGATGGIVGQDLGPVLPASGVTGAAFVSEPFTHARELLLALNPGPPALVSTTPQRLITVPQSFLNNEPEGLAATRVFDVSDPLGGVLHWQLLPKITLLSLFSRILNYVRSDPAGAQLSVTASPPRRRRIEGPALGRAAQRAIVAALR